MDNKNIVMNAACTAGVSFVANKLLLGEFGTVNYFGVPMDAALATSVGCGVGSAVSDLTSEYVIRKLGMSNQFMNSSTLLVDVGVCGAASGAVLYLGGLPMQSVPMAIGLGATAKLTGDYLNDKLFSVRNGIIGPLF